MRNYVIINGTNSNTINGLGINELPPISKPPLRVQTEEIDGRDGDIITPLGYGAYNKTITIGLFGTGYDIDDIVSFFNGEGTIVFSNEPDKYYNYKIIEQIDYESLQKFKQASITFHCQPFKYPLSETPKEIEPQMIELENVETPSISNTTIDTLKIDLKGNTSQASTPTPTSPIPVSVVSGDNEVVVCGKNLISSLAKVGNIIYFNGYNSQEQYPFKAGTYTFSYKDTNNVTLTLKTKNGTSTSLGQNKTITFTANEEFNIWLYRSGITLEEISEAQLEAGSTATSYEPYQSQTYEVDLPVENLVNNALFTASGGVTIKSYDNYQIIGTYASPYTAITQYVNVSTGKYTFSVGNIDNSTARVEVYKYKNGSQVGQVQLVSANSSYTIDNTDNSADQIRITLSNSNLSGTNEITFSHLQLEKGSKANTFVPYGTTPIELCKIGNYQDRIYKDNGNWYIEKKIGKVVLDGTESWESYGSSYNSINAYRLRDSNVANSSSNCLSNYYNAVYITTFNSNNRTYGMIATLERTTTSTANSIFMTGAGDNYNTLANFKSWLETNKPVVYYELTTPYLSLIEDNNLIEQLDNLSNATSYEGTTNVGQTNNDKAFLLDIKALEDGTNELVINNIGNIYAKPTIALEGNGNGGIYLNDNQIFSVDLTDKMTISTSMMEAYDPDTSALLNRQVIGNYNSMTLQPGNNTIKITGGISKATISDYTRWL